MKVKLLIGLTGMMIACAWAGNPLEPLKTDNPRDTMRTFMEAMRDYKQGLQTGNTALKARLDDAARCFDLADVAALNQRQTGMTAAIFLKEVIDRVIVIDYNMIPEISEQPNQPLLRWRLKDTEITIARVEKGERAGEYLFTADTTQRVWEFYDKVKHLPYLAGTTRGAGYQEPWIQRQIPSWAMKTFWGLAYWQWIGIAMAIVLGVIMRWLVSAILKLVDRILHKLPTEWAKRVIDILANPLALLASTGVWFAALYVLQLKGYSFTVLNFTLQIILFTAVTWLFYQAVDLMSPYLHSLAQRKDNRLDDQLVSLITRSLKIIVIILGALLALQNFGVQVVSLLAGLGIGGLAMALAAKDTLANFFGSIMIMFDRPFQIGHFINIKGVEGTVEDIGFRSTRIRTPQNSLVSIPNAEIANSNVDNLELRQFRRVRTTIGVTYNTPPEKLEAFINGIREIIEKHTYTRKDPGTINVSLYEFGDSSLNILINFFLKAPNWAFEMAERQHVFMEIIRLAKSLNVDFAFPSRTIYLESTNPNLVNRN
ncbi:MAG: mechanosensitive ion channel family protein [Verrucomicrobiota bacterium]